MAGDLSGVKVERKPKLSENVVQTLRGQILAGDFEAGEKLPTETRMTEIFGVSRTVVREAIAALSADGLVEPRHGAGVFVLDHPTRTIGAFTADVGNRISQAVNVLEVRMGIEIESAGLAARRRSPSQEARIQEAFFEFERLLNEGEPTGKADFAFHREIASATNNPFYVEILDALGDRTIPGDRSSHWYSVEVLAPDYLTGLQQEHLRILQAISAGDPDAARDAMRAHLEAAQERYRKRLSGQQAVYSETASKSPRIRSFLIRQGGRLVMAQSKDIFMRADDGVWEPTPDGNLRRIVCYTDELMMVEFRFEKGGEGWLHSHPHVQSSYVAEGAFEVTIDGRTETVQAGDSFIVPSGLQHGVKALEKGRLVDCFAPHRADFLK